MLQRLVIASALAFMCACRDSSDCWEPTSYPVRVTVIGEATEAQRAVVLAEAAEWNAAIGDTAITVDFQPDGKEECGRINLAFSEEKVRPVAIATTYWGYEPCSNQVHVRPSESRTKTGWAVRHELGHAAFNVPHEEDEFSAMYKQVGDSQSISDESVEIARAAME